MKKLGIIGGMGPESTLLYYKEIAEQFQKRETHGFFPELTIETVNMYKMLGYCLDGDYENLSGYLSQAVHNAESAGADFIILASNTPHVVFETLQAKASVPMLSIVEPVFHEVREQGLKKIAWLGTAFTMEQSYFKKIFTENGIEVIVPTKKEREFIDRTIARELEFGIVKEESKKEIDQIIHRLISEEGIDGIILGCTELPLMYADAILPVPCFDTMKYHIKGIVDYMLSGSNSDAGK